MRTDDTPKSALYKLQIIYLVESGLGPEHEPPEDSALYTTTAPPVIPRIGETYSPAAEDPPAGDTCIPWNVIDVEHTVWPEAGMIVFETRVFLERDKEAVADAARHNAERRAEQANANKTKPKAAPKKATKKI
ncbi:MAG TPA: hypothetical protein VGM90_25425 [Kofleriaceae bacterium]|jgi:hypothetical protein